MKFLDSGTIHGLPRYWLLRCSWKAPPAVRALQNLQWLACATVSLESDIARCLWPGTYIYRAVAFLPRLLKWPGFPACPTHQFGRDLSPSQHGPWAAAAGSSLMIGGMSKQLVILMQTAKDCPSLQTLDLAQNHITMDRSNQQSLHSFFHCHSPLHGNCLA